MSTTTTATETLDQALSRVWQNDWRHRRSGSTLKSQAEIAVYLVKRYAFGKYNSAAPADPKTYLSVTPADVTQQVIQWATTDWYDQGLSPATIQKRLNCLSKLGVNVEGCRVKVPKQLKWHLSEEKRPEVLDWLRAKNGSQYRILANLVEWTTRTGLRIEESLRLGWQGDISYTMEQVNVPGTKTASSQATLPLGTAVRNLLYRIHGQSDGFGKVFKTDYEEMHTIWQEVREHFGWQDDPTATLKALRRSAARYLHIDCNMPLHMVQQYLRHESMDTTLEYLRLTGGYGTEEMRRYLK